MKKEYRIITIIMLLPLALTAAGYLAAPDAIEANFAMHMGLSAITVLLGCLFMLQARRALKHGTHVGKPHSRVKVSGKKGEAMLLKTGMWLTGAASAVFSIMLMADIFR